MTPVSLSRQINGIKAAEKQKGRDLPQLSISVRTNSQCHFARVAIFFVEVTPQETSRLARFASLNEKQGTQTLHFKQPDGKDGQITLSFGKAAKPAV